MTQPIVVPVVTRFISRSYVSMIFYLVCILYSTSLFILIAVIILLTALPIIYVQCNASTGSSSEASAAAETISVVHPGYYQPSHFIAYKMPLEDGVPIIPPIPPVDVTDYKPPPIETMPSGKERVCAHWCDRIRTCRAYYFNSTSANCSLIGHVYPIMEKYDAASSNTEIQVKVKSHEVIYTNVTSGK